MQQQITLTHNMHIFAGIHNPPPTPEELEMFQNPPSLEKLSRDLYNTSCMAGFHLVMDGESSKEHNQNHRQNLIGPFGTHIFLCQHYQRGKP